MNYDAPANVKTAASPRELAGRARFGLEETLATLNHRRGALAVCAVLTLVTLSAIAFGVVAGPRAAPFVPICATVWSLADLLTAFLLLAQFYVKGTKSFGIVAVAYGLIALFTWPYLAYFPGTFGSAAQCARASHPPRRRKPCGLRKAGKGWSAWISSAR